MPKKKTADELDLAGRSLWQKLAALFTHALSFAQKAASQRLRGELDRLLADVCMKEIHQETSVRAAGSLFRHSGIEKPTSKNSSERVVERRNSWRQLLGNGYACRPSISPK